MSHEPAAVRFQHHYKKLKEFQRTRLHSSNTGDYLDCDAYRAIVEGGDEFVPFVIETIRAGDFFMNYAMAEITGVEMHQYFPDEQVLGEQEISHQWLRWWEENRDQYTSALEEP